MAVNSSAAANRYTVAGHTDLDIPNGQWAIILWQKLPASAGLDAGSSQRRVMNIGGASNGSIRLGCYEGAWATANRRKRLFCFMVDDDGTAGNLIPADSGSVPTGVGDDTWRIVVIQRTASNLELWQCAYQGTAYNLAQIAVPAGFTTITSSNGDSFTFGCGSAADAAWLGSWAEYSFISGSSLSQANIEALAAGADVTTLSLGAALKAYVPFDDADGATESDETGNLHHATKVGTPTTATHPYSATTSLYGRPATLATNTGSWTADSGVNLYDRINEAVADDASYIQSPANPSAAECSFTLDPMTDPGTNAVKIVIRHRKV